jgi:hypothetical protein
MRRASTSGIFLAAILAAGACAIEPVEPIGPPATTTDGSSSGDGTATGGVATSDPMRGADETGTGTGADTGTGTGTATSGGSGGACSVGEEGCPCTPRGACDPGLSCLSEFCVDVGGGCPIGAEGCPCTQGGACDVGLQCASQICVDPG